MAGHELGPIEMDDAPVIYGLEDFQARTLVSQAAESEKICFLVGTQSLKNTNQIQLIEFDDDSGLVTKYPFEHGVGEVWSLASAPKSPDLIATVYYKTLDYYTDCGAAVWRLPVECLSSDYKNPEGAALERLCDLTNSNGQDKELKVYSVCWAPEDDCRMVSLIDNTIISWDIQSAGKEAKVVGQATVEGRSSSHFGKVRWCPHQQATNVATTYGSSSISYDLRSMKQSWIIENAHSPIVRDLDFNPNRQYFLATCGDDGATKIWDVRNSSAPILSICDHSHWVWSVRFNPSYDQLVLTCSSDQRVILNNLPSVASQPLGALTDEQEEKRDKHNEDCILHTYEDHEESVYAVEWSSADFWTFASVSFDGRLVINKVPKSFKYKQFM